MADAYLKVKDNGAQGLSLEREESDVSVNGVNAQLAAEITARQAETAARQSGDTVLQNSINMEIARAEGEEARIEALFTAPTQEAVNNWLDDHPEATTTVLDKSLTESKFTDALLLKTINSYYTPEMFGAKGDGTTDDKIAIDTMLAEVPDNAVCEFHNNYYISDGLVVTRPVNIIMYGTLKVAANAGYCVRISGHNVRRNKFRLNLLVDSSTQNQWQGVYNTIGLDCYASWENEYDVSVTGFSVGIRLISTNQDCTYNKFFIRYIYNCKTGILLTGDATLSGGTTAQNTFIGGRIGAQGTSYQWLDAENTDDYYSPMKSVIVGSRSNNNNNFISCDFEGFGVQASPYENRAKVIADINYSAFVGCRYEMLTAFHSRVTCAIISGYGFDQIPNLVGNHSSLGAYEAVISTYTKPIILKRTGDSGEYLKIQDYSDRSIFNIGSDRLLEAQGVSISASNKQLFSDSDRTKILATKANPGNLKGMTNGDFMIGNPGYLRHKNLAGTEYTYMPIKTVKPSASSLLVTGMMVFVGGKPQWWDGSKWVYADGTEAT